MATESKRIRRDAFIKSVRPDPKSAEELVMLQGYIGDSDLAGHVRVYSDSTLCDFIELPEQEILYYDAVGTEEDSLGGSRLWVKKTTVFTTGEPGHYNRAKSSFLEGDIMRAFGDTGKIPTVVIGGLKPFSGYTCPPTICDGPIPPRTLIRSCVALCNISRNNFTCQVHPGDTIPPIPQTRFRSCIAVCISQNNVTCEVGFTRNQPACTIQSVCAPCQFSRQQTCNVIRCSIACTLAEWQEGTVFQVASNRCPEPTLTQTFVVNPTAQQQYAIQTYTGGFDPYQTANFGY